MLLYPTTADVRRGEILKAQVAEAGFTLELVPTELTQAVQDYFNQRKHPMFLSSWTGRPDPATTFTLLFSGKGYYNAGHVDTPELNAAVERANSATEHPRAPARARRGPRRSSATGRCTCPWCSARSSSRAPPRPAATSQNLLGKPKIPPGCGSAGDPLPTPSSGAGDEHAGRAAQPGAVAPVLTIVLATFVVFGLQKLIPGDPAVALAGDAATPERLAEIGASSTWPAPLAEDLDRLCGGFTGDLGSSFPDGQGVWQLVMQRLLNTLMLAGRGHGVRGRVGVPLGVAVARRWGDRRRHCDHRRGDARRPRSRLLARHGARAGLRAAPGLLPATGSAPFTDDPLRSLSGTSRCPWSALGAAAPAEICR